MRDLLITAVVLGTLPFVFRHAWIGVILWTWLSVMNPHRLAWSFAYNAPFAAMAAGATLIALFTTRDRVRLPRSATIYALIAFIVWMLVTTAFAISPSGSLPLLERVLKIMLMTLVAAAVLQESRHIQWFVGINAFSIGFFGVKGGLYTIATGGSGRVWGPGGFIGGNNEIGLAILVTIPLLYYLYLTTAHRWVRWGLLASMLLSAVAVLGTQSRGAFVAIAAMTVVLWWRAPGKLMSGVVLVALAAAAVAFMPESYKARIQTIETYAQDGSAMGRINAWGTALNVANQRPTGAGFDMYLPQVFDRYSPDLSESQVVDPRIVRAAHSIYFQVLGEHGWIGLLLFMVVWVLVWRDAAYVRRRARVHSDLRWAYHLAGMCQVALVGYGVGGAFLSLAYFDLPYNLLVCMVVTRRWLSERLATHAQPGLAPLVAAAPAVSSVPVGLTPEERRS